MIYPSVGFPNPSAHPTLSLFWKGAALLAFNAFSWPHPACLSSSPTLLHPCCQAPIKTALSNSKREANWERADQASSYKSPVYSRCGAKIKASCIRLGGQMKQPFTWIRHSTVSRSISYLPIPFSSQQGPLPQGNGGSGSDTTTQSHEESKWGHRDLNSGLLTFNLVSHHNNSLKRVFIWGSGHLAPSPTFTSLLSDLS